MTVFLLAPVSRVMARMDCPRKADVRIWARSSGLSLFMAPNNMTLMLDSQAERSV